MLLFDLMGLQIPWYYFAERANGNARMLEVLGCNVDDQVHTSTKGVPPILTSIYFPLSGKPAAAGATYYRSHCKCGPHKQHQHVC